MENADQLNVIHYSCESFYDNPGGGSRQVTSIAVLHVGSGLTTSFSIHQMAERLKVETNEISSNYDKIERAMLDGFYEHVKHRSNDHQWIHWNMRDNNYGFPAIAHRYEVLGGQPESIPTSHLFNLAEALPEIYGDNYMKHGEHGRLDSLSRHNKFTLNDFLSGEEEADAFVKQKYVKLHLSTLRKVRLIRDIAVRASDGRLKTSANWWQLHGASAVGVVDDLLDHPVFKLVSFGFALVGFGFTVARIVDALFR